jgi:hypothetical protein
MTKDGSEALCSIIENGCEVVESVGTGSALRETHISRPDDDRMASPHPEGALKMDTDGLVS